MGHILILSMTYELELENFIVTSHVNSRKTMCKILQLHLLCWGLGGWDKAGVVRKRQKGPRQECLHIYKKCTGDVTLQYTYLQQQYLI